MFSVCMFASLKKPMSAVHTYCDMMSSRQAVQFHLLVHAQDADGMQLGPVHAAAGSGCERLCRTAGLAKVRGDGAAGHNVR